MHLCWLFSSLPSPMFFFSMFSLLCSSKKISMGRSRNIPLSSSVTIQNVRNQSHDLWRYQRFLLIDEFRKKSLLPPPFNIIYCIISGIGCLIIRCQKRYRRHCLSKYVQLLKRLILFSVLPSSSWQ